MDDFLQETTVPARRRPRCGLCRRRLTSGKPAFLLLEDDGEWWWCHECLLQDDRRFEFTPPPEPATDAPPAKVQRMLFEK